MAERLPNPTEGDSAGSVAPCNLALNQHDQVGSPPPAPHVTPIQNGRARGSRSVNGRRGRPRRSRVAPITTSNRAVPNITNTKPSPGTIQHALGQPMGREEVASLRRRVDAGGIHPTQERRFAVSLLAANSNKQHACMGLFSQRQQHSTITASTVRFLGFNPSELPPVDRRQPLWSPNGPLRSPSLRFVTIPVEQMRIGLPPYPATFIVVDGKVSTQDVDLVLGQTFLQARFGGALPSETSFSSAHSETPQTVAPYQYAPDSDPQNQQNLWMGPATPQPLTSVDYNSATQQAWGPSSHLQDAFFNATTYQGPALSVPHVPNAGAGPPFLPLLPGGQQMSPSFPSLQTPAVLEFGLDDGRLAVGGPFGRLDPGGYPNGAQATSPAARGPPPQQSDDLGLSKTENGWSF